eukprot:900533-Pelagomonas_calceolata.AAC.2
MGIRVKQASTHIEEKSVFLDVTISIDETLSLRKPPAHSLPTLIACIPKPLLSLNIHGLSTQTVMGKIKMRLLPFDV